MQTIGNRERDFSLYFHIPFCSKKCPYCHFFVVPDRLDSKSPFVDALIQELHLRKPAIAGRNIVSIYFGGGTPTKLTPEEYAPLFHALRQLPADIAPDCEITLEANPEDVTLEKMIAYRHLGFNRVSIGLQSLQQTELLTLGRTHNAQRAIDAVSATHAAGFTQISVDLMFELPGQTLTSWKKTLEELSSLPITHLSLYNLTIEPNTLFFKQRQNLEPRLPPDEERLQMLNLATSYLPTIGLERYEISAFAKAGCQSRHNTGYWTARPFLGIGPSAFSYLDQERFSNISHLARYQQALKEGHFPVDFKEKLPYPQSLLELLAVELRLCKGVDLTTFTKRHGALPSESLSACQALIDRGWLEKVGSQLRLTETGRLFYDSVAIALI